MPNFHNAHVCSSSETFFDSKEVVVVSSISFSFLVSPVSIYFPFLQRNANVITSSCTTCLKTDVSHESENIFRKNFVHVQKSKRHMYVLFQKKRCICVHLQLNIVDLSKTTTTTSTLHDPRTGPSRNIRFVLHRPHNSHFDGKEIRLHFLPE
jgi:hypothetical protein